jgi:hypothetical protein
VAVVEVEVAVVVVEETLVMPAILVILDQQPHQAHQIVFQ